MKTLAATEQQKHSHGDCSRTQELPCASVMLAWGQEPPTLQTPAKPALPKEGVGQGLWIPHEPRAQGHRPWHSCRLSRTPRSQGRRDLTSEHTSRSSSQAALWRHDHGHTCTVFKAHTLVSSEAQTRP